MDKVKEVKKFILENDIKATIIEHERSGLTSEDAAKATGVSIENIIKTLLFMDKKKQPAVVICLGNDRVDSKKLSAFGLKKPRLAKPEELKQILETKPGETPPIYLPKDIPKFIDKEVMKREIVLGSAGSEFVGIKISPKDIVKFSNVKIVDITEWKHGKRNYKKWGNRKN